MPNSPRPTVRIVWTRCLVAATLLIGGCAFHSWHPENPPPPPPPPPPPTAAPAPSAPAPPVENSPEVVELLEKHIAAIGGREALSAIQTVDTQREAEVHKALQRSHEIRDKTSGRFYSKTDGPKGPVEMGFDGKRVWQKSPFFRGYLPETDPGAKNLSRRHPELFEYKETGQKFAMLPSETVDGKQLLVLYTRSAEFDIQGHETPVKYYFDPDSFLLRRLVIGSQMTQTIDFDDYREVAGTKIPFLSTATNPNITVRSRIKSIQYNLPLDPRIFEYQPPGAPPAAPQAGSGASG